jgi:23S rRNA pseudouridine1911/1915/1917 synthase
MQSLLDRLSVLHPTAKRTTLRKMIADRRVRVNGRVAQRAADAVDESATIQISNRPAPVAPVLERLTIVYEDEDLLVVNKPAGLLTSSGLHDTRPTALAYVRAYLAADRTARVGLIHRLDRDAFGLLVFSKSTRAFQSLKTQFFKHTVGRIYAAVTAKAPDPRHGVLEKPLEERADGTVFVCRGNRGQRAFTHYKVIAEGPGGALLRVRLETGRKHQIRVHLADAGWPIIGDPLYGGAPSPAGMLLCAIELELNHPQRDERMKWSLDIPEAFTEMINTPHDKVKPA